MTLLQLGGQAEDEQKICLLLGRMAQVPRATTTGDEMRTRQKREQKLLGQRSSDGGKQLRNGHLRAQTGHHRCCCCPLLELVSEEFQ